MGCPPCNGRGKKRGAQEKSSQRRRVNYTPFNLVLLLYCGNDLWQVRLQHQSAHDHLIQNEQNLVRVEDKVELADILKAAVQRLDKDLNEVQDTLRDEGKVSE